MTKRSDFAQKLLDDLRLRKDRMAASQTSNRSNAMPVDAYAYSKQIHKGSREAKTHNYAIASRTKHAHARSSGSNTSAFLQQNSNQLVPYTRGRNSEQIGDLSMALAFALENSGKFQRTDPSGNSSILHFLRQIGQRSFDFGKMEKRTSVDRLQCSSSSRFPTISHLHVKEISKGAQKLNQILKACYNGINFDGCSITIGQELLKGAIDLEESLRMLVDLQEASESMTTPQRKNRIVLLEDDGDEEEDIPVETHKQRQLDLPRFSFDKRNDLKQRLSALNYLTVDSNLNNKELALVSSKPVSHRRSSSYVPDMKSGATLSEQKVKREKVGIPNVIAKLMGLDNLPRNLNSNNNTAQQDSSSKPKIGSINQDRIVRERGKKTETKKQTFIEADKNPTTHVFQPTKNLTKFTNTILEVDRLHGELLVKNLEETKTVTGSVKAAVKSGKQQNQKGHHNLERNRDDVDRRENKVPEKGENRGYVLKNRHTQMKSEPAFTYQAKTGHKGSPVLLEKRFTKNNVTGSQQKGGPSQQVRHHGKEEWNSGKQRLQEGKQKASEVMSKKHLDMNYVSQSRKSSKDPYEVVRLEVFPSSVYPNQNHQMSDLTNRTSEKRSLLAPRDVESELGKEMTIFLPVMEEKRAHFPLMHKAKTARMQRKIDEVITRKSGTLDLSKPLKQQNPIFVEVKQRVHDKLNGNSGSEVARVIESKEVEEQIIESKKLLATIRSLNATQELHKEARPVSPPHCPVRDQCQILAPNDSQDQVPAFSGDEELICFKTVSNSITGTGKDITKISSPSGSEHHKSKFLTSRRRGALSESENRLKQILTASELFLNTAEVVFKIIIPIKVLNESSYSYEEEEEINLIRDCSYEVVKRKGTTQELTVHPCKRFSTSLTKVSSLDSLVKQLHRDFETLKLYGRNGKTECNVEDYLPKMLEIDVHNKEPDLNCMWDLGWNETVFETNDVVKDIEKRLLNELIDELTRDLLIL